MKEKNLNDLEVELLKLKIKEHKTHRKVETVKTICMIIALGLFGIVLFSNDFKTMLNTI